jgi:hypothetical protein
MICSLEISPCFPVCQNDCPPRDSSETRVPQKCGLRRRAQQKRNLREILAQCVKQRAELVRLRRHVGQADGPRVTGDRGSGGKKEGGVLF